MWMWAQAQFVLNCVTDVEAVFLRHHHIEKTQVRLLVVDCFERLFAVARREKVYAFFFELFQGLLDQRA
jgi:hypothetical protein